jgi:hypothetical protein
VCAACLKYSVLIFVEKIYKMQHLEGSGTPLLYIGRTVLKRLKSTYSFHIKKNVSQGNTENVRQVMGFKPPDHATLKQTVFDHHSFLHAKSFHTLFELFRNAHSIVMELLYRLHRYSLNL